MQTLAMKSKECPLSCIKLFEVLKKKLFSNENIQNQDIHVNINLFICEYKLSKIAILDLYLSKYQRFPPSLNS